MWVLCAPGGYKGRLVPGEAAALMESALTASGLSLSLDVCPLADGGRGTLDALAGPLGLRVTRVPAFALNGWEVRARLGERDDGLCVIESADVLGLTLLKGPLVNARQHTSAGLGDLISTAARRGAKEVWVALGDTGVVDGGRGLLAALRAVGPLLAQVEIIGLVDVDAPLTGPTGARRFMAQKGVPADEIDAVEAELFALHPHHLATPGAGAAGGIGAALLSWGGALKSGGKVVAQAVGLEARVARADIVLTGEGTLDDQSLQGKVIGRLAALCRAHEKPLIALCGRIDLDAEACAATGISATVALGPDAQLTLGAQTVASVRTRLGAS